MRLSPNIGKGTNVTAWNESDRWTAAKPDLSAQARAISGCSCQPVSVPATDRASINLSLLYGGAPAKSTIRPSELVVARPA